MDGIRFHLLDPKAVRPAPSSDRSADALQPLIEDIAQNGVMQAAIVALDGRVLGGWHRTQACRELGIELPAVMVASPNRIDERLIVTTDNDLDRFSASLELTARSTAQIDADWQIGTIAGDTSGLSGADRMLVAFVDRLAARGVRGTVIADSDGRVIDGWAWAVWYEQNHAAALVRIADSPVSTRTIGKWRMRPHPAMGRWGVKGNHRRISPLWKWALETADPGRTVDIGCGWGWHLSQLPSEWDVIGYEPYRRLRKTDQIDKRWVRTSIRRVADSLDDHGLFDHVVLDHVLFLTGSTEAALTALDAAATLLKPEGSLWVSSYWYRLKSSAADIDEVTRIGGDRHRQYVVRTWPKAELLPQLESRFETVTVKQSGETHLYRCQCPTVRSRTAVAAEFDLEWEDGTRPGVIDSLLEALP